MSGRLVVHWNNGELIEVCTGITARSDQISWINLCNCNGALFDLYQITKTFTDLYMSLSLSELCWALLRLLVIGYYVLTFSTRLIPVFWSIKISAIISLLLADISFLTSHYLYVRSFYELSWWLPSQSVLQFQSSQCLVNQKKGKTSLSAQCREAGIK